MDCNEDHRLKSIFLLEGRFSGVIMVHPSNTLRRYSLTAKLTVFYSPTIFGTDLPTPYIKSKLWFRFNRFNLGYKAIF